MSRRLLAIAALALVGCGDGVTQNGSGGQSGGGDVPVAPPDAGPRAFACPPGALETAAGCVPAGVDSCGDGFASDGAGGCVAIVPSGPCPAGAMALPGELSCRPVAPCGAGPWDGIPVDGATIYVDGGYLGGSSDGSLGAPYVTIGEAIAAAPGGALIAVAPGSYAENLGIDKPLRLWGKCPDEVTLTPDPAFVAVQFRAGSSQAELHGMAIIGGAGGVLIEDVDAIWLDRVWIDHPTWVGLYLYAPANTAAQARLTRSLIEGAVALSSYALGGALEIEDSVLRGTLPTPTGIDGDGAQAQFDYERARPASLTIARSVLQGHGFAGVRGIGADVSVERTLIADVSPHPSDGARGAGISIDADALAQRPGVLDARQVVIERTHQSAILIFDSDATLRDVTLRDVAPTPELPASGLGLTVVVRDDRFAHRPNVTLRHGLIEHVQHIGVAVIGADALFEGLWIRDVQVSVDVPQLPFLGLALIAEPVPGAFQPRSDMTVRGSLIEQARGLGIEVVGSDAVVEGTLIRDIHSNPFSGAFGRGISVDTDVITLERSSTMLTNCSVERVQEFGVAVLGSDVDIDSLVIRDVAPSDQDQFGAGILVQTAIETGQTSSGDLRWSLIDDVYAAGLLVGGADASAEGVVVRNVKPMMGPQDFGDAVVTAIGTYYGTELALSDVVLRDMIIEGNARAGVATFGANVDIEGSWFDCNPIHINGEVFQDRPYVVADGGKNRCGCGAAIVPCKVLSSDLEPPPAL